MRTLAAVLLCIIVGGCDGAVDEVTKQTRERHQRPRNEALSPINLWSPAFKSSHAIPAQYSCDGANRPPPIYWGVPPPSTKSFVLIVDDPDARGATFRHWGAYDIPATARSIDAGQMPPGQAINDMGKPGYGGPCPPKGHGPHRYRFKLYALNRTKLELTGTPTIGDLEGLTKQHAVGRGEMYGTYERR